jgi:hypothetical protein
MNQVSASYAPQRKRIETLTDVPAARLEAVMQEYRDSSAEVSATVQANGAFRVEAVFLETLDSNYSASVGRPVYRRPLSRK